MIRESGLTIIVSDIQDSAAEAGLEVRITEIKYRRLRSPFILIGVYRPPQAKSQWFDCFNNLTLDLLTRGKIIIMGDINADILRSHSCPTTAILNTFALAGTRLVSDIPTRVTSKSAIYVYRHHRSQ